MRSLFVVGLIFFVHTAFAVPVQWTLQGVYLEDGSQVTGSFTFDADAPIDHCYENSYGITCWSRASYSDVEIQVHLSEQVDNHWFTGGEIDFSASGENGGVQWLEDQYYHWLVTGDSELSLKCVQGCWSNEPTDPSDPFIIFAEIIKHQLFFSFDTPLTDAGGTIDVDGGLWMYVDHDIYRNEVWRRSSFVSGSIVGNVVPLPGAVWLFGSALAGLAWRRRRT